MICAYSSVATTITISFTKSDGHAFSGHTSALQGAGVATHSWTRPISIITSRSPVQPLGHWPPDLAEYVSHGFTGSSLAVPLSVG